MTVAGRTIRGVVYGILGTALAQAVMAGVGFLIAGVPGAVLLALLTFFFLGRASCGHRSGLAAGPPSGSSIRARMG